MNRCLSQEDLLRLREQRVPPTQIARLKQHLRLCDTCAARWVQTQLSPSVPSDPPSEPPYPSDELSPTRLSFMSSLEPNVEIDDFRIEQRLGTGAMGVVYLAHQKSLNREVALKVLPINPLTSDSLIERFHCEAQAVAKLHHPHIVSIYEERTEQALCYLVMERVEGQSLSTIIETLPQHTELNRTRSRDHFKTQAAWIATLAEALDYAHQQGVIHRDIKPSNIMVTSDSRPMLMDFGIARLLDDPTLTTTDTILGTPLYMSPEQIGACADTVDIRTDVYSLGATLYELITGQALYGDLKTRQQIIQHMLHQSPLRPRRINRQIPPDLETICLKAIAFDPADRYQQAQDMADDLHRYLGGQVIRAQKAGLGQRMHKFVTRHKRAVAATILILIVMVFGVGKLWHHQRVQWALEVLIPQIEEHIAEDRFYQAHQLTQKAERYIAGHAFLQDIWPQIACSYTIDTEPNGVCVYLSPRQVDSQWSYLGRTPLHDTLIPYGTHQLRLTHTHYRDVEVAVPNPLPTGYRNHQSNPPQKRLSFTLYPERIHPPEMAWILSSNLSFKTVHTAFKVPDTPAFLIDKYETTHREYLDFVNAGAYQDPNFWTIPFVKAGQILTWSEAMQLFTDQTGHPGPNTWFQGMYPEGKADHPVGGLSWYEAAAYAAFRGKSLPTIYHWYYAANPNLFAYDSSNTTDLDKSSIFTSPRLNVYDLGNTANFGPHPLPVGRLSSMGKFGLYDVAGNVREWSSTRTQTQPEMYYILGGAWGENPYMYWEQNQRSCWDRDLGSGVRCIRYLDQEKIPSEVFAPFENETRDLSHFQPISETTFKHYMTDLFNYDTIPLVSHVEPQVFTTDFCTMQRVTFQAAYGDERMIAQVCLPRNANPPYQTILWFPGSDGRAKAWYNDYINKQEIVAVLLSGRALVIPFYKATFDRRLKKERPAPETIQRRNLVVQEAQDLSRTLDYLETRSDIDSDALAYMGVSWGGLMTPIMIAQESRIKTGICLLGGICACNYHPAADPANFAPYVTVPMLMINTKEDGIFPYKSAQKSLFDLLGTSLDQKKHIHFPGFHQIAWTSRHAYTQAITDWLDTYLGPVEINSQ